MRNLLLALVTLTLILAACNSAGDAADRDTESDNTAATTPDTTQTAVAQNPAPTVVFDAAAETSPPIGSWLPVHFARDPDRVRTDVTAAFHILRDGALPPITPADYVAEECPNTPLARALLGDALAPAALDRTATLDITAVSFLNDRQVHIATRLTTANGALVLEDPGTTDLWVFQSGRWRATGDCPHYAAAE